LEYVDTNFMQGDLMYEESVGDTCVFKKIWCHREKIHFLDFEGKMRNFNDALPQRLPTPEMNWHVQIWLENFK
jgi:hypothetical protein